MFDVESTEDLWHQQNRSLPSLSRSRNISHHQWFSFGLVLLYCTENSSERGLGIRLNRLNCGPNLKYFFRSTFFHMCIKSLNTLTEINQSKCSGRYHRFLLSPLNRLIWPIWNHLNRLPACRLKYMPTCVRSARTCILHVTRVFRRLSPDILLKLLECKRRLFAWMGVQQRSARNAAL